MSTPPAMRLLDLLAARATEGLDPESSRELQGLLRTHPEWDDDGFEVAAAALHLAFLHAPDGAPQALRSRLARQGLAWSEKRSK